MGLTKAKKKIKWKRTEVKSFLDWFRDVSPFHMQGMDGFGKHGHTPYRGFSSDDVLKEYDEYLEKQKNS